MRRGTGREPVVAVGVRDALERGRGHALHLHDDRLVGAPPLAERARHGVRAATAFMAPLATAERQLNRAWSAAVDGATEESRDCVGHALAPLREARAAFPAS